MTTVGVLRTIPQMAEDPHRSGDQVPAHWDVIPGRKLRNDGVYPAVLLPGNTYHLTHDGIGWQLAPDGRSPHAYLVDTGLNPAGALELAHRPYVLDPAASYTISPDETGAWRLFENVAARTR